jgi:hypothetical protein
MGETGASDALQGNVRCRINTDSGPLLPLIAHDVASNGQFDGKI